MLIRANLETLNMLLRFVLLSFSLFQFTNALDSHSWSKKSACFLSFKENLKRMKFSLKKGKRILKKHVIGLLFQLCLSSEMCYSNNDR